MICKILISYFLLFIYTCRMEELTGDTYNVLFQFIFADVSKRSRATNNITSGGRDQVPPLQRRPQTHGSSGCTVPARRLANPHMPPGTERTHEHTQDSIPKSKTSVEFEGN